MGKEGTKACGSKLGLFNSRLPGTTNVAICLGIDDDSVSALKADDDTGDTDASAQPAPLSQWAD